MEVHHHAHTARKKFFHYFWEFFMLFMAVTLGFFVENQREHMVEHTREKQYIQNMIVDLNADTTKLSRLMNDHAETIVGLDSIIANFDQFATGQYTRAFFQNEGYLEGFTDFIYTDRTINQLKSSGGMRLIRKQVASDSIIAYDDEARDYLIEQDGIQRLYDKMDDELKHLLNRRLAAKLFKADRKRLVTDKSIDLLLTHDKQQIEGFYNLLQLYRNSLDTKKYVAGFLKARAVRLIAFLKEQYHIN